MAAVVISSFVLRASGLNSVVVSVSGPQNHSTGPVLSYGTTPRPGGISILRNGDGSVTLQIVRHSHQRIIVVAATIVVGWLVLCLFGFRGYGPLIAFPVGLVAMVVPVIRFLIVADLNFEAIFIVDSDGFRGQFTDSGDERQIDIPAGEIVDLQVVGGGDQKAGLLISTPQRRIFIPIPRRRKQLRMLANEARCALGFHKFDCGVQTPLGAA